MARVDVAQHAVEGIDDAEKQRQVGFGRGARVKVVVETRGQGGEIRRGRSSPEHGLGIGHQQRGGDAFARDVAHEQASRPRGGGSS